MTARNTKIMLFASLIAVLVVSISVLAYVEEQSVEKNPRDKTLERLQEKNERDLILKKINALTSEEEELQNRLESETNANETKKINLRIDEIRSEMDKIDRENHEKVIPQEQLDKLTSQQNSFEERLLDSEVLKFVTSIGIDITSKEIQVGLDQDIVNSENIDSIVEELEKMMPPNAKWHVVYSDRVNGLQN